MAEYGVVLALITLAVVGVITALGLAISGKLGSVRTSFSKRRDDRTSGGPSVPHRRASVGCTRFRRRIA